VRRLFGACPWQHRVLPVERNADCATVLRFLLKYRGCLTPAGKNAADKRGPFGLKIAKLNIMAKHRDSMLVCWVLGFGNKQDKITGLAKLYTVAARRPALVRVGGANDRERQRAHQLS
jgi:hypothetical protein